MAERFASSPLITIVLVSAVSYGKTGYLSNVGDYQDMANHAIEILSEDTRLETFKKNAIEHARTFEKSQIIPLYEQLYDEVLNSYKARKMQSV